jgi:hypothetical protein
MPPAADLAVVRSKIHGYGMVARRRFAAGEVVVVGDGVPYHDGDAFDDTYALVFPAEDGGPAFAADVAADPEALMYFDLVDQTRWINHCCEPNTRVDARWDVDAGATRAWWVAVRDIEPGEELSYDYAFVPDLAEPCNCGAAGCRGLIVDADELDAVDPALRAGVRPAPPSA